MFNLFIFFFDKVLSGCSRMQHDSDPNLYKLRNAYDSDLAIIPEVSAIMFKRIWISLREFAVL